MSPGSNSLNGIDTKALPTIKIDPSDHPFIKYDIFEDTVTFPARFNPINIITYYCEHHNMTYISQSNNNSQQNRAFPEIQRTNAYIISVWIKEPTTVKEAMEAVPSQQLTGKCNKIHVIKSLRDRSILRKNFQRNRSIFNHIRHIQSMGNTVIILPTKPTTQDHIGNAKKKLRA